MASASSASDSAVQPTRKWIARGAAAFLIVQALIPLRYYLSQPTSDERFAWRMFSTTARRDCHATLYQTMEFDGRRIEEPVPPIMLAPWQTMLNRNRPAAVEKIMKACCQATGVVSVRFRLECGMEGGDDHSVQQFTMNRSELRVRELAPNR
jgi:hypothetical protein